MADAFIKAMEGCFSNFIPRKNFTIIKVEENIQENYPMGELI